MQKIMSYISKNYNPETIKEALFKLTYAEIVKNFKQKSYGEVSL